MRIQLISAATLLTILCGASATFGQSTPSTEVIRPPGSLELVGLLRDDRALNQAHDVELEGDLAFVPGKGGSLAIIDVRSPSAPRLISSLVDPVEFADAETVLPMGDVLLLGTRDFFAIDISDPAKPRVLKKIADRPRIDLINGMARLGNHVLTANKSGYIGVIDVADPKNPKYVGALHTAATGGPQMPHDIAVWGNHAIVVDSQQHQPSNVFVYRIAQTGSTELLPVGEWKLSGKVPNGANSEDLQGANRVVAWGGRYAGVGAFQPDRVGIIDVTDTTQPRTLANMPVCDIDATGMAIYGSMLLVSGGECVEAIDVSNPSRPVSVAQYRGGRLFPTRGYAKSGKTPRYDNGHDLVYRDGYIYVTAQNDNSLGILKITDPKIRALAGAK
ncbi:MAG: hypothetical protein ABI972_01490 [Acidobacteriota bacterium]